MSQGGAKSDRHNDTPPPRRWSHFKPSSRGQVRLSRPTYGEPGRGHPVWSLGEEDSRPFIKQALEAGINFFDTANVYSDGTSEEILGRALRDFADRDEVVIATKVHGPMRAGPNGAGLSRKAIMTEIDASLRRLGTDYVDLYQIHRWDYQHADRGDARGAARRREGRQGALHRRVVDVRLAVRARRCTSPTSTAGRASSSMQNHYNLLYREEEREMLPLCADEGIGVHAVEPAGARPAGPPVAGRDHQRSGSDPVAEMLYTDGTADADRAIIDAVGEIAAARGVSRATIALAWLHHNPVVAAPIIGANTAAQIDDAVASLDIELTDDELERLQHPYTSRYDFQGLDERRRGGPRQSPNVARHPTALTKR